MATVVHSYQPRSIFIPFHQRFQRWALLVAHRRAGKTVATVNDQISRALYFDPNFKEDPRFAYIAPFYSQAKKIAWGYLKRYARDAASKIGESDLSITIKHNQAVITLFGADNPDSFRGLYFDGVILDEFGNMRPSVWSEVLLPTLIDRRGWATFIGTPNGPNHFRDLYLQALKDPKRWFVDLLPVSRTLLIPEEELEEMRRLMTEEEYEQEMECSFEASSRGAFYSKEVAQSTKAGHIGEFPPDPDAPLHFVFDVGRTDDTALGAFQEIPEYTLMVHAEAENNRGPAYWLQRIHDICLTYGCRRGRVWLPHDARAKTWASARSGWEQFVEGGIRPNLIPNLDILDGINAGRYIFQHTRFNETTTESLILALKSYRRNWDEDKQAFSNDPVHDWSSHPADMFRYFALVARFPHNRPLDVVEAVIPIDPNSTKKVYPISLEDMWRDHERERAGVGDRI